MTIEFREINIEDFEEVKMLVITHEYSWRDSDPESFIARSDEKRNEVTKWYMRDFKKENSNNFGFVALEGSVMVGSHLLEIWKIDGVRACHIHGLWVHENYRGRGIAHKLKKMGEDWAKKKNCVLMDSNVKVTNESMIALNKKMGYEIARFNFRKKI